MASESASSIFFDRPDAGERALLLSIRFQWSQRDHDLEELSELATSAELEPVHSLVVNRPQPDPGLCLGRGKVNEVKALIDEFAIDLIIVDHELTPTQQRNLEGKLNVRVLTRTELIVNVFASRARTYEGKLQVELACWEFARTHVVRGWTHLDRQRGGVNLRGAGESQRNIDKGLIQGRITAVKKRLEKVSKQRQLQRHRRETNGIPTIALAGYTNAGKSTLFNRLCEADVYADDRLFATLDPTMRQLNLPEIGKVVLADTVGFVRDLPHTLVAAFQATLEEVKLADLILHVIDSSSPDIGRLEEDVQEVLNEIGASQVPVLKVFNKIDKVDRQMCLDGVQVSATEGTGTDDLIDELKQFFTQCRQRVTLHVQPKAGKVRAQLFNDNAVVSEAYEEDGSALLKVVLDPSKLSTLLRQDGVSVQP